MVGCLPAIKSVTSSAVAVAAVMPIMKKQQAAIAVGGTGIAADRRFFDQTDLPAGPSEVVGARQADDAAADHHNVAMTAIQHVFNSLSYS